jgi:4-carboxymuconolactone decarboxylase
MSRYPPIPSSQMTPEYKSYGESWDAFLEHLVLDETKEPIFEYRLPNNAVIGPYPILIASKDVGIGMRQIISNLQKLDGPGHDCNVVAILTVAAKLGPKFGKYCFSQSAKKVAGLTDAQIKDLRMGKKPAGLREHANVTWDMISFLANEKGSLPDALYDAAVKVLGKEGALVVAHWAGFYLHVFLLMNFADVPYPPGIDGEEYK